MDYWHELDIRYYENLSDFFEKTSGATYYYCSTKAKHRFDQPNYADGDYFVFGKESRGLSETLISQNYDKAVRIPMAADARSLNLSNSVAVVLYEALRHIGFQGLSAEGELTGRKEPELWK